MYVIDATDRVAGRLASQVAKKLLDGDDIAVVNAEKAVISGDSQYTTGLYMHKHLRGDPYHGPHYPKTPDRILRRIIRGMIPRDTARGRAALKRLTVHVSVPLELKDVKALDIGAKGKPAMKYMYIGTISERLGAKKLW